nr:cobalt-precorrin-5B (C(1))-methyltransferase CbiD [Geobacter sp. SVR]
MLRHGYTTGACAAAAAKGAALMLVRQESVAEVSIELPAGVTAGFGLHGQRFDAASAACFVIKDAGDDPDVTNGAEVHAVVTVNPPSPPSPEEESHIVIQGGIGIGKATKPGLAVAPGEWAINPVPRQMIEEAVRGVFPAHFSPCSILVTISIPNGEALAQKTLNARLGIVGGLSILGTTGIVRPISAKAWTDTIDTALDVARACGCPTVMLSTGRTSELAAQRHLEEAGHALLEPGRAGTFPALLPEEACIMMGDHVAHALKACSQRGFYRPLLACQFAKLLKIACGHENTHAAASDLDLATLRGWAERQRLPQPLLDLIGGANTAREIVVAGGFDTDLLKLVCDHASRAAHSYAPDVFPSFLIADYTGKIAFSS